MYNSPKAASDTDITNFDTAFTEMDAALTPPAESEMVRATAVVEVVVVGCGVLIRVAAPRTKLSPPSLRTSRSLMIRLWQMWMATMTTPPAHLPRISPPTQSTSTTSPSPTASSMLPPRACPCPISARRRRRRDMVASPALLPPVALVRARVLALALAL